MGNSLRCCLACVLPCGALDLIRIVHLNGYVEEITRAVTAGEVLKSYPNHVLSKPCSMGNNMVRKIMILSPDSELKRGSIYFLLPDSSLPSNNKSSSTGNNIKPISKKIIKTRKIDDNVNNVVIDNTNNKNVQEKQCVDHVTKKDNDENKYVSLDLSLDELCTSNNNNTLLLDRENVVEEVCHHHHESSKLKSKSKSKSGRHQRRRSSRGKSGVWQPHLQSITEDL